LIRAKLLSTAGPYLEAKIEVNGQTLVVMDEFSVDADESPKIGSYVDLDFTFEIDHQESWESIFSGNSDQKVGVDPIEGWSYRAFGQVLSISPVVVDCGLFKVEGIVATHDMRVVGSFVAFTILRLGGYAYSIE
jgi:hypothetical protein